MGKSYLNVGTTRSKSDRDVPGRVVAFLRMIHPSKTAESVAAATGVSENTVKKWLTRSSVPNGVAMLTLAFTYGPEFLAMVGPGMCGWISKAAIDARQERIDAAQARINQERAELGL